MVPQPHPRRIVICELDTSVLKHFPYCIECGHIGRDWPYSALKAPEGLDRNSRSRSQLPLLPTKQGTRCPYLLAYYH